MTNDELQFMMTYLRKSTQNYTIRKQIRAKRKSLKDQYYHEKAISINNVAGQDKWKKNSNLRNYTECINQIQK